MLTITPIEFNEAQAFVARHHRHHRQIQGHKFSLAVVEGEQVVGVAIIGRPVARGNDNGWTLEVTRCCTDGTPNACSKLYSAARRAAAALGYRRLITYILASETGNTLKAANWTLNGPAGGGSWNCASRPRVDKHPTEPKLLYTANLA
jgi:hypothetical protein